MLLKVLNKKNCIPHSSVSRQRTWQHGFRGVCVSPKCCTKCFVIFVYLDPEYTTVKHLLCNFLLLLDFHWFWFVVLPFVVSSHLNPCVKIHQADATEHLLVFASYSGQKWSPWLTSHVFQHAICFHYQPICVVALAVRWGFLILKLWLVLFSLCCNFAASEKQTVIPKLHIHPTEYWKERKAETHFMQDRDEKSESTIQAKSKCLVIWS